MSSTVARFGVVLLALMQLGVWSFYAPAHRLWHHTCHGQTAKREVGASARVCHHGCCSHAKHRAGPVDEAPASDPSPGCPHDADHCAVCVAALQQAHSPDPLLLDSEPLPALSLAESAAPAQSFGLPTAFDCRGPPAV